MGGRILDPEGHLDACAAVQLYFQGFLGFLGRFGGGQQE